MIIRLLAVLNFTAPCFSADRRAASQPNVLFIAVDDLACTLGCYGDLLAKTPHIDRLAMTGTCFLRAYNQIPLCNPSRASILTGQRPDQLEVYDLDRHFREAMPDVVTIPQAFQQAGYRVARVGKIYHYDVPAAIGTAGLDDPPSWQLTVNPSGRDKVEEGLIFNAEPQRKISAALSWLAADGAAAEQTDGLITTEAIRLLREYQNEPFFLAVGFFRPHTPYVAPKRYFELYPLPELRLPFSPADDRDDIPAAAYAHNCPVPHYGLQEPLLLQAIQAYYACVSMIDDQVGRLLEELDQLQLTKNTIVVFWSDHGYHLGDHAGIWQKRTLFENAARTPLIIRGLKNGAGACQQTVELIDIYPTLMDLAGIETPPALPGQSLQPLLIDPQKTEWNGLAVTQILRPADNRLQMPVMGRSIRSHRYRYTEWNGGEAGTELYDYHSDPQEFRNLAIEPTPAIQTVIDKLHQELETRARSHPPATPFNPARL